MLQVLNFYLKVLLQARDMGYAKIHLKKESIRKNGQVSNRRKKKEKKRKIAHELYAHA
jgi:ribosome-associated protein YbcJ (S4-like RNA binding protein)